MHACVGGDLNGIPEIGRVRSPGGSITRNKVSAQRGRAVRDGLVKAVLAPRTGGSRPDAERFTLTTRTCSGG